MSIVAMNWAMKARTDGVSAQCVLMVVADTANERGVSIHADPDYIAERTRQSRATVFRRLNELEAVGALTRLKRYRDNGAPVYEITLHLARDVDYDKVPDDDGNGDEPADDEAAAQAVEPKSQIETHPKSQSETGRVSPVRLAESHSCDSLKESVLESEERKNPPNPPAGGDRGPDDPDLEADLGDFAAEWGAAITNMPRLRALLGAMARPTRRKVITAIHGYNALLAECERKRKPRARKDADRWVAGGMWQGYVVAGEKAEEMARARYVPADSPEGLAWALLHKLGNTSVPSSSSLGYLLLRPLTPQELALAQAPPESAWAFIGEDAVNQVGAWNEITSRALAGRVRGELVHDRNPGRRRGFMAPWPWPPRKDGTINATAPPIGDNMTQDDVDALTK